MLVADVIELGDAVAGSRVQTAHVTGVRAEHALHEMLRVARLVTLAAEVRGTAEAREVREMLLRAVVEALDAVHVVKMTAVLY